MLKPRIKTAHHPIRRPDGMIWIGSQQYGLGSELDDESGLVWPLCHRMDGTLTREELVRTVAAERGAEPGDVVDVLDFLIESGWVEDVGAEPPTSLSERELERYDRSVQFQAWIDMTPRTHAYELQAKLKASTVAVLGVGGIGSAVAAGLAASGVGRIHCVDFDTVELSNLNRQLLYVESDLGRSKVEVAVERLGELNRDIEVTGSELRLSGPEDVVDSVRGSDVFLLCADGPKGIEHWADQAALRLGVPWVNGAYAGPMLCVGTFIPGETGCQQCMLDGERERRSAAGHADLLATRRIPGFHPVMAPTAQMAGHFAALEALFLLWGMPVQTAGRKLHRNFLDYDHQYYIEAKRRPDCPICGDSPHPRPAVEEI
ncbi:HesA/MoeB/ThiF family protein [Actinoallomurus sp. CA-150999]|uniref:HesA/MoeB/ThiF family protein n=1 Tax=Actinoallomurus sp. CA-150999 TaxID=3239887 RepID=UPI003D931C3C